MTVSLQRKGAAVSLYSVPYSEHSSFTELRAAVAALAHAGPQRTRIIPTVNCRSSQQAAAMVAELL